MKTYRLETSISVAVSLKEAFAFFEDPRNLARLTPPWLNFRITSPGEIQMRKGAEIRYRIRWLGLPLNWKTVITEYEPPFFFVDEQAAGPYAFWRHRHTFKPTEYGALVSDRVDYALPLGPLGRLMHGLVAERQLQEIFAYRQKMLAEILTGAPTAK
ncbi:MAG TPA: SRPBCC family protein [Bryobacteraceae bacterium]|nr:SRPBCC family protein [Bryobacteraceae bacterium]